MQINGIMVMGVIIGFFSFLPPAWSGCHFQDSGGVNTVSINLPASITVPSDTPSQTLVWSSDWTADSHRKLKCESGGPGVWHVDTLVLTDNTEIPGTYLSGSHEFALRVSYRDRRAGVPSRALKGYWHARKNHNEGEISVQPEYRVDIITKQQLSTGTHVIQGGVMSILMDDYTMSSLTINSSSMIVNSTGCNVLNDNILVNLGRHDVHELARSRATEYVPFNVDLDCDKNVRISYSINGRSAGIAFPGVLMLNTESGGAKGIGVQIVDENNHPIPLNRLKPWKTTSYKGIKTMHLQSRYMRTARDVIPGQANATATLSFVYR